MSVLILSFITIFTSVISAIAGMGGGVLLISLMTFVLPYTAIVPIHGVVQFVSNSSRAFYLRKNVRLDFFVPFVLATPIGLVIAYQILSRFTRPDFYYLLLALFILYVVFKPKHLPQIMLRKKGWATLGAFAALQGSLMGAAGPLIAPFYIRDDLSKEEVIATKAAQQLVIHFSKIPLFLSLDFNYSQYSLTIIAMSVAAMLGTFSGVKILAHFEERMFKKIFKSVLTISALRLMYKFWESTND